jgi:hypothetical protein
MMKPYEINSCIKEPNCILIFSRTDEWLYVQYMQGEGYSGKRRLWELLKDLSLSCHYIGGAGLRTIKLRYSTGEVSYDYVTHIFPQKELNDG